MPKEEQKNNGVLKGIVEKNIVEEMRESYLDYAMSVIVARALPDVRDGLKPVHRRILYAMHEMGLSSTAKQRKSAAIVGDTLGKYHPHGDIAVYDSLVRMAQDFSLRYPLIDGQGNFGCFTKDTKVKLTDGRNVTFEELIKEDAQGKKNYTYTVNSKGLISITEIKKPRLTKKNAEIIKIILDNNEEIKCTPNHLFMLRNGVYKEAHKLKIGESLMPLYQRLSEKTDRINRKGYLLIHQNKTGEWVPAHHLADNYNLTNQKYSKKAGRVRHHIDFNKLNNNPDNYEQKRNKIYNYVRATSWEKGIKKYYNNNQAVLMQSLSKNHKVKKIEFLKKKQDVYDLTIDATHNFALATGIFVHNSIDGDSAAAMRYTEARMSKIAGEMLRDIDKETVDFVENYDGTKTEPVVLPATIPQLLLNGSLGIAVGMATNIPPHNLNEVIDATIHLIDKPKATLEELIKFVKGPDFPTGGLIFNTQDIHQAYATGRGGVLTRGEAEILEKKQGQFQIIITSIPYQISKAELITKMAELVREKKIEGIRDIRDESDREGLSIAIDLSRDAHPQKVLNSLYKHTDLERVYHFNTVALVDGIQPQLLSLKSFLEHFIAHRRVVTERRTRFDLLRAQERAHILEGLKKALDHIDAIIQTIKKSPDKEMAHKRIMEKFRLSDKQATAILEMKLQSLAGLERQKIEDELREKQKLIKHLQSLLEDPEGLMAVIKTELSEIKERYGDERKTKIVTNAVKSFSAEDLIPERPTFIILTKGGYIKRVNPEEYRTQKRGGKGISAMTMKEEDIIDTFISANTHDDLLFFTNSGKVYKTKAYEIPEGKRTSKGKSVVNFLAMTQDEQITSMLALPKSKKSGKFFLIMVTENGIIKKVASSHFDDVRRSGLIALRLKKGDTLRWVRLAEEKEHIIIAAKKGKTIRFKESDLRPMGRTAAGVRAMRLSKGNTLIGTDVFNPKNEHAWLFVISEKGYGKKTVLSEYRLQRRGGAGIKTMNITAKTGMLMGARAINETNNELIALSQKGQIIRIGIEQIPALGRSTQGVRLMKLEEKDAIASITLM